MRECVGIFVLFCFASPSVSGRLVVNILMGEWPTLTNDVCSRFIMQSAQFFFGWDDVPPGIDCLEYCYHLWFPGVSGRQAAI